MKYDFLIVGSGLYGATFAYFAKTAGKKCLVIDRLWSVGVLHGRQYVEDI